MGVRMGVGGAGLDGAAAGGRLAQQALPVTSKKTTASKKGTYDALWMRWCIFYKSCWAGLVERTITRCPGVTAFGAPHPLGVRPAHL